MSLLSDALWYFLNSLSQFPGARTGSWLLCAGAGLQDVFRLFRKGCLVCVIGTDGAADLPTHPYLPV